MQRAPRRAPRRYLKEQGDARYFISEAFKQGKAIGATGESVELLLAADLGGLDPSGDGEGWVISRLGVVTAQG